jgi:hypothetical protein
VRAQQAALKAVQRLLEGQGCVFPVCACLAAVERNVNIRASYCPSIDATASASYAMYEGSSAALVAEDRGRSAGLRRINRQARQIFSFSTRRACGEGSSRPRSDMPPSYANTQARSGMDHIAPLSIMPARAEECVIGCGFQRRRPAEFLRTRKCSAPLPHEPTRPLDPRGSALSAAWRRRSTIGRRSADHPQRTRMIEQWPRRGCVWASAKRQTIVALSRRSFRRSTRFRLSVGADLGRRRSPMPLCTGRSNVADAR